MRVRYLLHNAYGVGGTIRTVVNQANALCSDHDVEIASVYRTSATPSFTIDERVRLVSLTDLRPNGSRHTDPPDGNTRFSRKTRRFPNPFIYRADHRYRRWDPVVDLAIARYLRSARDGVLVTTRPALNMMSARLTPRRVVRVAQDHMNLDSYGPRLRAAILKSYPRLDAVTVLTEHDLAAYEKALEGVRLERIPNGIPPKDPSTVAHDRPRIVASGRLAPQKGFDMLLDAWATVSAKHPEWELVIYGSGPGFRKLVEQRDALGLRESVRLPGVTSQLDAELSASAMFVLSSRYEGLPMVLLEAMSCGLPVVSFDCPTGPGEVITDGVNGRLVPPADVDALAATILELIDSPERRLAMGEAAYETSRRFFMPSVRDAWERFFASLTPR
ncbi:glycosyltransferase family 4 protein [Actinoplanes solisilvae]|uniref:glycosyltransferase family 4 protein n=1 Tax=Actinoplanes solisilvae TaxID=2486853 RepID=UPI000FDB270F|nr:glycosyltransferase family 4 protein [Actinoplanes solisilvae]